MSSQSTPPSVGQRAGNFAKAIVRHASDRFQRVDDAAYQARLAICRGCPECNVAQMTCRHARCGCRLKLKARWASESCPLEKWPNGPSDGAVPSNDAVPESS